MRLPTSFIGRRREGRWYCEGEIVDGKWTYSMLLFWGEVRKGRRPLQKGKRACEAVCGGS
jgi:hypothetical protein